jgi:hypothetical protein
VQSVSTRAEPSAWGSYSTLNVASLIRSRARQITAACSSRTLTGPTLLFVEGRSSAVETRRFTLPLTANGSAKPSVLASPGRVRLKFEVALEVVAELRHGKRGVAEPWAVDEPTANQGLPSLPDDGRRLDA